MKNFKKMTPLAHKIGLKKLNFKDFLPKFVYKHAVLTFIAGPYLNFSYFEMVLTEV